MENYIKLKTKLQLGKSSNINYVQKEDLNSIEEIKIDTDLPKTTRIIDFIEKVKNPYMFIIDGRIVKVNFAKNGANINECINNLVINHKN